MLPQILNAQSDFLEQVNFTNAPDTVSISVVGIPLDSLRPDNVTYSSFAVIAVVCVQANLVVPGSNLFAAGFGDKSLQSLIFSGMQTHPIWDDFSIGNDTTISVWSARSVRLSVL